MLEKRRPMKIRSSCLFAFSYVLAVTAGNWALSSILPPVASAMAVQPIKLAAAPAPAAPGESRSKPNSSANPTDGKDVCLGCHGPFDKLAAAPKTYTTESGEKINPHLHVPHDRTDAKSIVECTNCHEPHPVPWTSKAELPKPKVDWCYSCHHMNNFSPCKTCHH
jgi:predicted CXXCH cytochrome family protein